MRSFRFWRLHRKPRCPQCGTKQREAYCGVCGYGIVEEAQAEEMLPRRLV